jgi:probable HAF family extracellular repeat protein
MTFSRYVLTDIGTLPDRPNSHATAINTLPDRTQVVGWCGFDNEPASDVAFLWERLDGQPPEEMFDFRAYSPPQIFSSRALGLNSIFPSTIVGFGTLDGVTPQPMIWTRSGSQIIPTFPEAIQVGEARSVNNGNVIVGYALTSQMKRHAFVQLPGMPMIDLGTLKGAQGESDAFSINNRGWVAGTTETANPLPLTGKRHACVWLLDPYYQNASNAPIEDEAGDGNPANSYAYSINDGYHLVGESRNPNGDTFADRWQVNEGWLFPTLVLEYLPMRAYAVNNADVIVGAGAIGREGGPTHAFVTIHWTISPLTADLNTLVDNLGGWTLIAATGINDRGQIVGDGVDPNGMVRAWLLTPT